MSKEITRTLVALVRNGYRLLQQAQARKARRRGEKVSEIADRLGVDPSTVYRWTN